MNHIRHSPFIIWLLIIGIIASLPGCGTLKEAKLLAPSWFGLEQIAPSVYVSRDVTGQQRAQLLAAIPQARNQLIEVYGSVISSPNFYGFANIDRYKSFNGYGNGRAIGESGILLLPVSFSSEVLSHEWSHVELYARVGNTGYGKIPMWFHEGLAVAVSKLPRHSDETLRKAESRGLVIPKDIKTYGELKAWSRALKKFHNDEGLNVMYAAAGHEVRDWLKRVDRKGLLELLDAINAGEDFVVAYNRIAQAAAEGDGDASNQLLESDASKLRAAQL